jgi:hypothetical protein
MQDHLQGEANGAAPFFDGFMAPHSWPGPPFSKGGQGQLGVGHGVCCVGLRWGANWGPTRRSRRRIIPRGSALSLRRASDNCASWLAQQARMNTKQPELFE